MPIVERARATPRRIGEDAGSGRLVLIPVTERGARILLDRIFATQTGIHQKWPHNFGRLG